MSWPKGRKRSETTIKKMSEAFSGEKNPQFGRIREKGAHWKGGRKKDSNGYILILRPDHSRANNHGYVYENLLIAEKVLGRPLKPNELTHHINEKRDDNRNCNLIICAGGYHQWLHHRMKIRKQLKQEYRGEDSEVVKTTIERITK